jgi:predicted nucleotidyltransferase
VKLISLDRPGLLAALTRAATAAGESCPEVVQVLVFGSLARGDHTGLSDADVLIVVDHGGADPLIRARRYQKFFDFDVAVDLIVLTAAEIAARSAANDTFLRRVAGEQLPLWRRAGFQLPGSGWPSEGDADSA